MGVFFFIETKNYYIKRVQITKFNKFFAPLYVDGLGDKIKQDLSV
jgi:hypothetical protein